jgi:hypothetical protein
MGWNGHNVAETKSKSTQAKRDQQSKQFLCTRTFVACLIVLVAAALAIFFVKNNEVKPTKAEQHISKPQKSKVPKDVTTVTDKTPIKNERDTKIARIKAMTPEERLEFLYEEAKNRPLDMTPSTNKVFKTGIEQVMSWIFSTRLGDPPPPLPQITIFDEVHLAEIIIADNPILETDSARVKECKEMVALAKKELVKFIKEGGDVEEFLTYYRDQLREAHHEYVAAQRKIINAYKEGIEPEVCRAYADQINAELAEKGIKQFEVPQALIDKFSNQK